MSKTLLQFESRRGPYVHRLTIRWLSRRERAYRAAWDQAMHDTRVALAAALNQRSNLA